MHMKQKVALVTNIASTGVALSIGQRLGATGARLILTDPNEKSLRTIVSNLKNVGIKASGVAVDLSKTDQRKTCFEKIQEKTDRLDVVIPCVLANTIRGDIIEVSKMQLDECYHQNLTSPFRVCQSAIPLLKKSADGSIVFVISFAGYTCFADIGLYSATQTAALGMVKAMAQSLAKDKIRVNSVVHGMLSDDGANGMWNQNDQNINNGLANLIPIGRVGKGSDCAPLVEFLASAKYITGENTCVTGGINVRL